MQLVHVIPISRGITKDNLSYFTREGIAPGMLVRVPIRSRLTLGIVARAERVVDAKAKIRHFDFPVKKIESLHVEPFFDPAFMEAVYVASDYFATQIGLVIHQLVPAAIRNNLASAKIKPHKKLLAAATGAVHEISILQAQKGIRFAQYKNIIREAFARKESVFLCVPTVAEVGSLSAYLKKGIEPYTYELHGSLTQKQILERFELANNNDHPILIVGTGTFLSLPRCDIRVIILEHESSRFFKQQARPFIDIRTFAHMFAKALKAHLIIGDMPLKVETNYWAETNHIHMIEPPKSRAEGVAEQIIVDMRSKKEDDSKQKKFELLSGRVKETLIDAEKSGERVFIFTARRGIAPTTVCEECGNVVTCKQCGAPVVLHKRAKENVFVCHKCGETRSAKERCKVCNSWKLKPLGIGTERIKEAVAEIRSDKALFAIDGDTTTTHKRAENVAKTFYKTPGAILIGTEMALPYLEKSVEHTVIASVDALLSLPDPFVHERVFRLLLDIRALGKKSFVLQTRQPDLPLLSYVLEGSIRKFYESEIEDRRLFNYPPCSLLIRITASGSKVRVTKDMERIEKIFSKYRLNVYPAFIPAGKNKYSLHALIRIDPKAWPNELLLSIIKTLPPNIAVNVAPQSTL